MQIASGEEEFLPGGMARITRVSSFTRRKHVKVLPITEEQFRAWRDRGVLIQDAMPNLLREDREFLMTGTTQDEWDAVFGEK